MWYKQHLTQFSRRYCRWDYRNCTLIKVHILSNRYICLCILPRDSNWSINRVYIDEINNYLCCKSKLNGINFINHTDWTFQDGSLKPNLFYADKLHLIKEGNAKLAASIFNSINPNASNIIEIVSVSSKVFACDTGFNLKQEEFPMLPCNVSVPNSVCNPDEPTVKCVRKSIYKFVSTSSVLPG